MSSLSSSTATSMYPQDQVWVFLGRSRPLFGGLGLGLHIFGLGIVLALIRSLAIRKLLVTPLLAQQLDVHVEACLQCRPATYQL